jgi:hypothetical protein
MHLKEEEFFMVLEGSFEFFGGEGWTPFAPNESKCSLRGHVARFPELRNY